MFRIINETAGSCSYMYGQIEVKLGLSRFLAEYLIRSDSLQSYKQNHLDDMISKFDSERYFDENASEFSREELKTYGSLILIEMGMVFKGLYLDKDQISKIRYGGPSAEDNENSKIDICICLCVLLSKS